MFWNPQDEQISKLILVIKFDQDLMEKRRKTSCLILETWYCSSVSSFITLSLNTISDRKFAMTYGQWQMKLRTSAKQTSLTIKSEKSSFLRKMLSKISNFKIKNIWPPKNIWRTLEDVKSNFGQLLFSTSSWFFHSLRSYWALKKSMFWGKIFLSKYFWKF